MNINRENSVVSIVYTLKENTKDQILDSNVDGTPLEFITGKSHIIAGLEKELINKNIEDKDIEVFVNAIDGYGMIKEDAIQVVPKDQFEGIELKEGLSLYGQDENSKTVQVVVKSFNEDEVTIDFNHPLAGKDLLFNVNILNIRDATVDESLLGKVAEKEDSSGCCGSGCGCH